MKKYVVVVDISPSEQINKNDDEIKVMALVFGLGSYDVSENVGNKWPDTNSRLTLKKWSKSGKKYKNNSVNHIRVLCDSNKIIFGANITSNKVIRDVGTKYWKLLMHDFPLDESGQSSGGRSQVTIKNLAIDGKKIEPLTLLKDELIVLGWYAEALVGCLKSLCELNNEKVKLDVLIDKLPNEQGGEKNYKGVLLRDLCRRGSDGLCNVVGVPEISDKLQRDLLVDNIAGLRREIFEDSKSEFKEAISIFRFTRENI